MQTMSESVLTRSQKRTFGPKTLTYYGERATITAEVRFDDECGNGHNTFAITGTIRHADGRKRYDQTIACGCLHEQIAEHFPELAPLIRWHLVSSDGPMHYIGNTLYLAGERDCWGYLRGEQKRDRAGKLMWMLPTGSYAPIICADERPTSDLQYVPVLAEGKERELDKARHAACWPDATDEDLAAPGLEARLQARLPQLLSEFRAAVESLGLRW